MRKINDKTYLADAGKLIVRKDDESVKRKMLRIRDDDSVDNYEEKEMTREQLAEFRNQVRERLRQEREARKAQKKANT